MPARVLTYKKGTAVVKIQKAAPAQKQNVRHHLVRSVISECVGMAPYERHLLEMIHLNRDRQALRYAKKRIGKLSLAKAKVSQLMALNQQK
ncbi:Ribosomal protein L36 [Spironucleus salmonicida]|uniref:Ribosomal protein L36 n=1 Tax=Spironucleus salmonicida TaxID=348837 RepID=V6LZF4_9EUKA|nr:Ribosomal protein L36 [Spironucleus salmonicida]KAH0573528.1 Ribosomal protein L36 [Spironucleus salmonicida]|eukprot:EST46199.1 Ribosomal protein L36 [Spironucleus salmonicida]